MKSVGITEMVAEGLAGQEKIKSQGFPGFVDRDAESSGDGENHVYRGPLP